MNSSFIPPPFPFPEAWSRIFAEEQQGRATRWMVPTTFVLAQRQTTEHYQPLCQVALAEAPVITGSVQQDADDDDNEEDGDYEYGYILSDEWRERFRSSVQLERQNKSKKKSQKKKKVNRQRQKAVAVSRTSRVDDLQHEIQAAKTHDLTQNWKPRGDADTTLTAPTNAQVEMSLGHDIL